MTGAGAGVGSGGTGSGGTGSGGVGATGAVEALGALRVAETAGWGQPALPGGSYNSVIILPVFVRHGTRRCSSQTGMK